jgi:hypothetical protein
MVHPVSGPVVVHLHPTLPRTARLSSSDFDLSATSAKSP